MSRIDIQVLVAAFESRISALEKNPPDKVPTSVVLNLLERAVDEEIRNHFSYLTKRELIRQLNHEFKDKKIAFIKDSVQKLLNDDDLKNKIVSQLKNSMLKNII